jgi:hypothetical protein
MSVLLYGRPYRPQATRMFRRLKANGANSVSLVFPVYTDGYTSTRIYTRPDKTPRPSDLSTLTTLAHRHNLRVLYRPTLDEESLMAAGKWRGSIQPSDTSAWFASYRSILDPFVRTAERSKAEGFSVGVEFSSLENESGQWRATIRAVRRHFKGHVTYGVNWDRPVPPWANRLTYLGVDAFYPLNVGNQASVAQLRNEWSYYLDKLAASYPLRKIVFTEVGVPARVGAHREPWEWDPVGPDDYGMQLRYYTAVCEATRRRLRGLFWWRTTLYEDGSPFDPMGRPASRKLGC